MIAAFRKLFGSAEGARVFRAPGRVNLIGEHTDYNLGFVLPVALDLATSIVTAPAQDGKLRIHSEGRGETKEFDAAAIGRQMKPAYDWTDYPIGVARQLVMMGVDVGPANLLIRSTVPEGSGLSSSAALEVASALAFLRGRSIDPLQLAKLCQSAEREFVGMPCGIMDQYISVFGRDHSAVEIDCRSLTSRYVTLPEGASFVAVNTMVKHALAGSAYRDRVAECKAACKILGAASLRDVTTEQFAADQGRLPERVRRRARHVVTEDARVNRFVDRAAHGDLECMGRLMVESHRSLQRDYEVSCTELDFLVGAALSLDGVYGARMTGGGFGGCTVTLLRADREPAFRREIAGDYLRQFGVEPHIYTCRASVGAGEVSLAEEHP
jgi:galactokinase